MTDTDDQLQAFGEFVRAQRRLAQVSQRNLARMSGVSDSYLSQIERGNYRPSPQVVKALATAFGLEPKQLYMMLGFMDDDENAAAICKAIDDARAKKDFKVADALRKGLIEAGYDVLTTKEGTTAKKKLA